LIGVGCTNGPEFYSRAQAVQHSFLRFAARRSRPTRATCFDSTAAAAARASGCRPPRPPRTRLPRRRARRASPQAARAGDHAPASPLWQQAAWLWTAADGEGFDAATGTNNTAEFVALLEGLRAARALGARWVSLQGDSQLVLNLVSGSHRAHKAHLQLLLRAAAVLLRPLRWQARHVGRDHNADADALCARGFALAEWAGGEERRRRALLEAYRRRCAGDSGPASLGAGEAVPEALADVAIVLAPAWIEAAGALGSDGEERFLALIGLENTTGDMA
jgi:ribonuclease HI